MTTIVIATGNENKVAEIRALVGSLDFNFKCSKDFPDMGEIEEDGKTLKDNAIKKAKTTALKTGLWAFADDTGLEVEYLNGAPGVFSARYAGEGCSYSDNNAKLLKELKGVPLELRKAVFKCVVALSSPKGDITAVEGILLGVIAQSPRGLKGFGYDSIFMVKGIDKTMAELSAEEKNNLSHRARAIEKIIPFLPLE
ncbi:MAG: RdgB/HAM1 family non-canonical purine NTP pyrophosphatase [Elusimicrobiota bacterium]|nr:RdgB/HAM1 family non-canonical purine NTP pyrophosphatase [Elusimicrobiota bacterium]